MERNQDLHTKEKNFYYFTMLPMVYKARSRKWKETKICIQKRKTSIRTRLLIKKKKKKLFVEERKICCSKNRKIIFLDV